MGKHIAGATTFISNITLWYESGYFDNSGETKPLLHLWSLAVEEQFYIFWPIMLWLAWKKNLNLIFVTLTALTPIGTVSVDIESFGDILTSMRLPLLGKLESGGIWLLTILLKT